MTLPLVSKRTYGSAVNECRAWQQRATAAERRVAELTAENTDLLAANGVLEARVEHLAAGLGAAQEACEHLKDAAGVVDGAQVLALQKELATAREQIARQDAALAAYERDHEALHDDLRRLAEQRDTALATVERLKNEGGWTPSGVAS